MSDDSISFNIVLVKNDIINFIRKQLSVYQPRDDYKVLLHLSLIFLGQNINEKVTIKMCIRPKELDLPTAEQEN